MCDVEIINAEQAALAAELGLDQSLFTGAVQETKYTRTHRSIIKGFEGDKDAQEYELQRIWRESNDFENLAGHMAERALQVVDKGLRGVAGGQEVFTRYFMLDGANENTEGEMHKNFNWLLESNFRTGLGVLATLHTGQLVRLPEIEPNLHPSSYPDFSLTFAAQSVGNLTIQNTFQRYEVPDAAGEAQLGTPFASTYRLSLL